MRKAVLELDERGRGRGAGAACSIRLSRAAAFAAMGKTPTRRVTSCAGSRTRRKWSLARSAGFVAVRMASKADTSTFSRDSPLTWHTHCTADAGNAASVPIAPPQHRYAAQPTPPLWWVDGYERQVPTNDDVIRPHYSGPGRCHIGPDRYKKRGRRLAHDARPQVVRA